MVNLNQDLTSKGYVYFEPVCHFHMYQVLDCLKSHYKFYNDISVSVGLSSNEMLRFSEMEPVEGENLETVPEKIIENEPPFTSIENHLIIYRIALHETALDFELEITSDKENVIVAPGQGKTPVSLLYDDICEKLALWYPFQKENLYIVFVEIY